VNLKTFDRYNHEVYLIKHAKPNQANRFVRYNYDRYNRFSSRGTLHYWYNL